MRSRDIDSLEFNKLTATAAILNVEGTSEVGAF